MKPYNHQLDAIKFGLTHDSWLLLDEMGTGKSSSIIHIAEELKRKENIEHCFVICAVNSLKANWKKEIQFHSNETYKVLGEKVSKRGNISYASVKERCEEIKNPIDEFFIITNIETLRSKDFISAFKKSSNKIDMIVVDEVHRAANKSSQQGANLLKLDAKYKIGATGTLLTSSPINAYLPLKWIGADKANLTTFKQQYCNFGGISGFEIVSYKNTDILKEEIAENSLRRTKEDVLKSLPEKNIIKEYISLSDEHRKFYNNVKAGVKEECDKIELNTNNLLALVTRLRQATSCPSVLTSENILSSKLQRAVDIAIDLVENNEKVVIFSGFKEAVYTLEKELKKYNPIICTGDFKDDYISQQIDEFQNNPDRKIIIATHQKLGTGVTLTAASYMIFIDTPFNYSEFSQSCDRIHRIGAKKNVFIYNLICEDTIDERVAKIVDRKQVISDYMIDNKINDSMFKTLKECIEDL